VSHVIQVDDLEVRDNLTVETWPVRIEVKRGEAFARQIDHFGEGDLGWSNW